MLQMWYNGDMDIRHITSMRRNQIISDADFFIVTLPNRIVATLSQTSMESVESVESVHSEVHSVK